MIYVVVLVLVAIALGILKMYNSLIRMKQLSQNSWADVDVYLKRRAELIPNLVNAVKGYMAHESGTLERVMKARGEAVGGPGATREAAELAIASGMTQVLGLAEAYPDLKASENFQRLQDQLTDTERLIASARQYYNACVRDFNIMLEAFPTSIVAGMMGLKHLEFFQVDSAAERAAPRASL